MMLVTLKILLIALFIGEVLCQYIPHPYGGFSYISNTNFHQAVGYSYVAPTGQTVNVKLATSATVQPPRVSARPQISAPKFVFHSAPSDLPLSLNYFFEPQQAQSGGLRFSQAAPVGPPDPASLFIPAFGAVPIESAKQLQAYKDYVKQLAEENERAVTEALDDNDPESLSYVSVELGEK